MGIKEIILQRIEALLIVGGFTEEEIARAAMQYASEAYLEALQLRFQVWTDLEATLKDLFKKEEK